MTGDEAIAASTACAECRRRARLLAHLSPEIDRHGADRARLSALLGLPDHDLVAALGIPRRGDTPIAAATVGGPTEPAGRDLSSPLEPSLCRHTPGWPVALDDLAAPPAALHVGGSRELSLRLLAMPSVAIVGTRSASDYGRAVAHELAAALASAGVCSVSGMAKGIDAAVHEGALHVGGPTVAVVGGGVDILQSRPLRDLHRRLCEEAAVVSELPAGAAVRTWALVARSRMVNALARVTVVVEASLRSGVLMTAGHAAEIGREVAALPGPVTSETSAGTNALLHDGARLVRDAQDVLDLLFGLGGSVVGMRRPEPPPRS